MKFVIEKKYYIFLFLIILLVIYGVSFSSEPALGDSLSFTLQANYGLVLESNATTHFLYSNVLALLHFLLPFLNVHYLFTGFSSFCAILFLYNLNRFLRLFDISQKSSLICVALFGLSFTFWRQAIITEVYTFYLLFVVLFLIKIFEYLKLKDSKKFYIVSFLFGLMLIIHIQSILFFPLYFYLIIRNFKHLRINAFSGIFLVFLIFSILLIPVYLGRNDILSIFTDDAYQSSIFNFDLSILLNSFLKNMAFFTYNFLFFILFIFWGFRKPLFLDYLLIGLLPFLAFVLKHNVSDIYVFHLVPYVILFIFLGRGLDEFSFKKWYLVLLLPIFYFGSYKISSQFAAGKKLEQEKHYKGGLRYMMFPPLRGNPDLKYFKQIYFKDSLYKKPELKAMYPDVIEWEKIDK